MLRVRPIVYTSKMDEFAALFTALGLDLANDDDGWQVFNAGSGRVALHSIATKDFGDNTVFLGFEVGDVEEFTRRTVSAGTRADIIDADHGRAAQITAPDGLVFVADAGPRTVPSPGADPALAVAPTWYCADTSSAVKVLKDIGARPRISSNAGVWTDFTAKNGGLVAVHGGEATSVELSFEYDGDVTVLEQRLARSGFASTLIDENYGRSLRLPNPHGGEIWINERQRDLYGFTEHS